MDDGPWPGDEWSPQERLQHSLDRIEFALAEQAESVRSLEKALKVVAIVLGAVGTMVAKLVFGW